MSKRNSREAKARRRAERAGRDASRADLVEVNSREQLAALAGRGEPMPCGCNPVEHMAAMDAFARGETPPGWQAFGDG
jgi:hypothetical protein